MNHPLLQRVPLTIFIVICLFLAGLQSFMLVRTGLIPLDIAIVDSTVFHSCLFLFGLSSWYFVSHTWNLRLTWYRLLIVLLLAGVVEILIWVAGSYILLAELFSDRIGFVPLLQFSIPGRMAIVFLYYLLVVITYFLYLSGQDRKSRIKTEVALRESLKETELSLLKSQINPHFLFNSLNSASLLTLTEPEKAHEMIVALSEYLRYSISGNQQALAPLSTELENVRRYLSIEKIRFGDRLEMQFKVEDACHSFLVPAMILQPLYENAIKHGVYEATTTVWINTIVERKDDFLRIEVTNSFQAGGAGRKGAGLGIRNVKERLRMIYGTDQAWLQTEKFDTMFVARLSLPARKHESPVDR